MPGYNNGNNYYQQPYIEVPPTSQRSSANPLLIVLVGVLAAMIIGLGVWWALSGRQHPLPLPLPAMRSPN